MIATIVKPSKRANWSDDTWTVHGIVTDGRAIVHRLLTHVHNDAGQSVDGDFVVTDLSEREREECEAALLAEAAKEASC